jgi:RNA polymerase primary sigma factor
MRRLQQRVIAYIMPTLTRSVVQRFGDSAYYIGKQVAQALLSMSVVDNTLHTNEVKDSIQFLALLRDNRLLTHDDFDKYKDLFHSRVDQNINTDTVLQWAQEIPVQLWTHHQDNAQKVTFGVTNQQHLANQIVFTLSGVSLISYAFLYVLVSDLRIDPKELQLIHKILAYFEKPESLFRLISSETTISAMTKNILGSEIRVYVQEFITTRVFPVELMQRIVHSPQLLADAPDQATWTMIVDEITEVDSAIIVDQGYFASSRSIKSPFVPQQIKLPLEIAGTIVQKHINFPTEDDLNAESIDALTRLIEDEDEQAEVASQLYDLVIDEFGSVPESSQDNDVTVMVDTSKLSVRNSWNTVLRLLLNTDKVTYQIMESSIATHVPMDERIDAYQYVILQLHANKKRIYDQIEIDDEKSTRNITIASVKALLKDVVDRMDNTLFATYKTEYVNTYLYHKLLSSGEEHDLCVARNLLKQQLQMAQSTRETQEIQQLHANIRDVLINHNFRLVMRIASMNTVHIHHLELMDLFQEGCIGLITAVDKFDITRGYRLSTYATWWIRQSIGRAIDDLDRSIRLPVHFLELIRRYRREVFKFESEYERPPNSYEIAALLQVSEQVVAKLNFWNERIMSLHTPVGDDKSISIGELVEDEYNLSESVDQLVLAESIREALKEFSERARYIIIRRFGLDGCEIDTLEQIGEKLGITRERVRQIEAATLKQLRIHNKSLADFI